MEIPKNTKNITTPYKRDVFEAYKVWRTIPVFVRLRATDPVAKELTDEDSLYGELIMIRNQTEFAQKYGVENSTLTNWNNLIRKNEKLSDIAKWGRNLTKNVLFSLYRKAIQTGDPSAIALWFQIVNGWSSKNKEISRANLTVAKIIVHTQK